MLTLTILIVIDISIRNLTLDNELVTDVTIYTDIVFNVELFLRSNDYFGYTKFYC
jgi:hypothetical protein